MGGEMLIACALTGSADTPHKNSAVPVTPKEIAQSAIDAALAGAAIIHVHVRDPKMGGMSIELEHYRETVERIRDSGVDVILNLTTGPGGRLCSSDRDPERAGPGSVLRAPLERIQHLAQGANDRTLAEIKHELDRRLRLLRQNPCERRDGHSPPRPSLFGRRFSIAHFSSAAHRYTACANLP